MGAVGLFEARSLVDVADPESRHERLGASDIPQNERKAWQQCVLGREEVAHAFLWDLEEAVVEFLAVVRSGATTGFSPDQIKAAIEMSLADATGKLSGTRYRREGVEIGDRGVWFAALSTCDWDDERRLGDV